MKTQLFGNWDFAAPDAFRLECILDLRFHPFVVRNSLQSKVTANEHSISVDYDCCSKNMSCSQCSNNGVSPEGSCSSRFAKRVSALFIELVRIPQCLLTNHG